MLHVASNRIQDGYVIQGYQQGEVTPIDSVQTTATGVKNGVKQSNWKVKWSKAHRKLERVKHS